MTGTTWRWRDLDKVDVTTPHWLHDCPTRRGQMVISAAIAETTGCPDCGEKPMPWRTPMVEEQAS